MSGDAGGVLIAFGHAVRRRRVSLGLSQEMLAQRTGLHRTYIGSMERGERNVSLLNIVRTADALSLSVAELMLRMQQEADHAGVIPPSDQR